MHKDLARTGAMMLDRRVRLARTLLGGGLLLAGLALLGLALWHSAPRALAQSEHACSAAYQIDQTLPTGTRWEMCWEQRAQDGIVLYDITYTPPGGTRRLILAQAGLAQVHVPYDDNGARFHDVTDYGFGGPLLQNLTAAECPGGTLLKYGTKNVLCMQTEARGYAQKYYGRQVQGYKLSLFSVSTSGDYNYIPHWEFYDDGTIAPSVGAAGQLQRYGTDATYGWVTATNRVPISHYHNYWFRLDFDIDGRANDRVQEIQFNPADLNRRREKQVTNLLTEAGRQHDPDVQRTWRVLDTVTQSGDGNPISYQIEGVQAGHDFTGPDFEPFAQNDFYVTAYKACEDYPSHNPAVNGCAGDVSAFVNGESVDQVDLVVWYGITFHHLPREEDEVYMDVHWDGFTIIPRDWTATNPLDRLSSGAASTSTPTRTPTATPTLAPGTTPTNTPTWAPTATPTIMPPAACSDVLANGAFDTVGGWSFGSTAYPAGYVHSPVQAGTGALRLGIPTGVADRLTYSSAFQRITLPAGATSITLRYFERASGGADGIDAREAMVLDKDYNLLRTLVRTTDAGSSQWVGRAYNLNDLAGQTVILYFNVYNNGTGGQTWAYLDSASLTVCGGTGGTGGQTLAASPQRVVLLEESLPRSVAVYLHANGDTAIPWQARSQAPWIQLPAPTGQTPGSMTLQVAASPSAGAVYTGTVDLRSTAPPTQTLVVQVVVLRGLEQKGYLPLIVGPGQ